MEHSPRLATPRLLLRPLHTGDAASVFAYRSDAVVNRYQGWIPATMDDVHDFLNTKIAAAIDVPDTWFQLAIVEKTSGDVIGDIGIHFPAAVRDEAEVGCTLSSRHHGKGIATEALQETIGYIFTGLHKRRVVASIDPRNTKSVALVERLGFHRVEVQRILLNGEWVDDAVYELVKG